MPERPMIFTLAEVGANRAGLEHECLEYCHCCPALDGAVLAGCLGMAVYGGMDPVNIERYCTCKRPDQFRELDFPGLCKAVDALCERILALESAVADMKREGLG